MFSSNYTFRTRKAGDLPLPTLDDVSFWIDVVGLDEDILDRVVQSFGAMYIA